VSGNRLIKDGQPYLPRGFNMVGLLTPAWCDRKEGIAARDHLDQAEMDAAKSWNANTLRFQLSQRGLADSAIAQTDRDAYLVHVKNGVSLARGNGFTVILSMQEQEYGCGSLHPLPTDQTLAAWNAVVPEFKNDPYVMFELYNEPSNENDPAGWNQWQNGGTTPNENLGDPAVGHQALVDEIRRLGSANVLIADGVRKAGRLSGMPLPSDPTGNLMYGVHPYYFTLGESWWEEQYGYLTPTVPVIATEWNYPASACGGAGEQLAPSLLGYLHDHNIGVLAHAFDASTATVTPDWTWSPTMCGTAYPGSGQLTKDHFATQHDPDTAAPSAPTNVMARVVSPTQVNVTWGGSVVAGLHSPRVSRSTLIMVSAWRTPAAWPRRSSSSVAAEVNQPRSISRYP